ncbi:MAG: hypothetical protein HYT94_02945 [Parcubacteria group bacterium]|nr:hypothetical protein [Parcubacteria group bacterium]
MPHQNSSLKKSLVIALVLLLVGAAVLYAYEMKKEKLPAAETPQKTGESASSLQRQMEDGPVLEGLPVLPNVPAPENTANLIQVESLHAGDRVQSPLIVTGQARGNWFFEASFPIKILDKDGIMIGQGHAEAQDEWMTENFVPWKATVSFIAPASGGGEAVFMKDNPSGLPEHDAEVRVPVLFAHPQ